MSNDDLNKTYVNQTLITLIFKIDNLTSVNAFRLNSLCNMIYKIISKCIKNKMKPVMGSIILKSQSPFADS